MMDLNKNEAVDDNIGIIACKQDGIIIVLAIGSYTELEERLDYYKEVSNSNTTKLINLFHSYNENMLLSQFNLTEALGKYFD